MSDLAVDRIPSDSDVEDNDDSDVEDNDNVIKKRLKSNGYRVDTDGADGEDYGDDNSDIEDVDEGDNSDDEDSDDDNGEEDDDEIIENKPGMGGMNFTFGGGDNDEDIEDEDDETFLQKFEENLKTNIITQYHPEMIMHNNEEVELLTNVVRDKNGIIIDPLHKSVPFITRYEKARVLGERAKQIDAGAQVFVDVEHDMIDGYLIALKEFNEKKIPFIIKRPISGNHIEYWKLSDLEIV